MLERYFQTNYKAQAKSKATSTSQVRWAQCMTKCLQEPYWQMIYGLIQSKFISACEMRVVTTTGCPKKMYICFAHSFHTFLRNLLKHTSKDSQIRGDLLTPPPDSVTCPWRSRCHVLEVGVPEKCTTFKSGISQKLCTWYVWFWCHPIAHFMEFLCLARAHYLPWSSWA